MTTRAVRVVLPAPLRVLAAIPTAEVTLEVRVDHAGGGHDGAAGGHRHGSPGGTVTQQAVLDALEAAWPALTGTVRDQATGRRRPFVRFFACGEDLSHEPPGAALPEAVSAGREPFVVLGAIAGG